MRRRDFIVAIGGATALPMAALAQKAVTMRRVGILVGADPFRSIDGFKKGLVELGWTEGRNIRFEERRPEIDEQLPLYAAQLAKLAPDAIYVQSSPHLQAIWHATSDIPFLRMLVILSARASFRAWLAPAATLPASPPRNSLWRASNSTCSRN
jgi:putative ABC transport system substrate-binding protein